MEYGVEVRKLVKVFNGEVRALDGVNLKVEGGKVFAMLGPNGAGKTTLVRILTTQLPPDSGDAFVFGHDVVRESAEVRRLLGYVPQEMSVWTDLNGYENLLIYAKLYGIPSGERSEHIRGALESIGLSRVARNLVKTYSGGMIRRLEIACALLVRPRILFLDEPTIGLDPGARKVVWDKLNSFKREYGTSVFFTTHYMDEADLYSDEICIINNGKVIKKGTAQRLKRSLGGEIIVFDISRADGIRKSVLEKVGGLGLVKDVVVHRSELDVVVDDAEVALPRVMGVLVKEGVTVKKVSMNEPNLDDVFLKYAGTRLETGGRISDVRQARRMIRR